MPKDKNIIPIDKELESHLDFMGFISTNTISSLEVGDIVQVNPHVIPDLHAGLLIITQAEEWGIQGYLAIPRTNEEQPGGNAYYRLEHGTFKKVGHCAWIREEEE